MDLVSAGLAALAALVLVGLVFMTVKIVQQWEQAVVLRFERLSAVRDPGIRFILPFIDRMIKVDLRIITLVLEPQEVITRDNVTIRGNAVVYFRVVNPTVAVI